MQFTFVIPGAVFLQQNSDICLPSSEAQACSCKCVISQLQGSSRKWNCIYVEWKAQSTKSIEALKHYFLETFNRPLFLINRGLMRGHITRLSNLEFLPFEKPIVCCNPGVDNYVLRRSLDCSVRKWPQAWWSRQTFILKSANSFNVDIVNKSVIFVD